jgi:Glycosyl transferase family 2
MNINIFLLCYNESALLPQTIAHYKKHLPSCKITIYDNNSADNSVKIATSLGCKVIPWNSDNIIDDNRMRYIKNNCWKTVADGWIIVADMDEFLCITEDDLKSEKTLGNTIISIRGLDMIGESDTLGLTDIDLQKIVKYVYNKREDKNLCFYRNSIGEMNYAIGAHQAYPIGDIKYSQKIYYNKHMSYLGLNYIVNKTVQRYNRSEKMRGFGLATHYTNNKEEITQDYNNKLEKSRVALK